MAQLKGIFETSDRIFFYGCYDLSADPLMPDRDHVSMTTHEIWKVSGYHFR